MQQMSWGANMKYLKPKRGCAESGKKDQDRFAPLPWHIPAKSENHIILHRACSIVSVEPGNPYARASNVCEMHEW
jgi:hypothetical protein